MKWIPEWGGSRVLRSLAAAVALMIVSLLPMFAVAATPAEHVQKYRELSETERSLRAEVEAQRKELRHSKGPRPLWSLFVGSGETESSSKSQAAALYRWNLAIVAAGLLFFCLAHRREVSWLLSDQSLRRLQWHRQIPAFRAHPVSRGFVLCMIPLGVAVLVAIVHPFWLPEAVDSTGKPSFPAAKKIAMAGEERPKAATRQPDTGTYEDLPRSAKEARIEIESARRDRSRPQKRRLVGLEPYSYGHIHRLGISGNLADPFDPGAAYMEGVIKLQRVECQLALQDFLKCARLVLSNHEPPGQDECRYLAASILEVATGSNTEDGRQAWEELKGAFRRATPERRLIAARANLDALRLLPAYWQSARTAGTQDTCHSEGGVAFFAAELKDCVMELGAGDEEVVAGLLDFLDSGDAGFLREESPALKAQALLDRFAENVRPDDESRSPVPFLRAAARHFGTRDPDSTRKAMGLLVEQVGTTLPALLELGGLAREVGYGPEWEGILSVKLLGASDENLSTAVPYRYSGRLAPAGNLGLAGDRLSAGVAALDYIPTWLVSDIVRRSLAFDYVDRETLNGAGMSDCSPATGGWSAFESRPWEYLRPNLSEAVEKGDYRTLDNLHFAAVARPSEEISRGFARALDESADATLAELASVIGKLEKEKAALQVEERKARSLSRLDRVVEKVDWAVSIAMLLFSVAAGWSACALFPNHRLLWFFVRSLEVWGWLQVISIVGAVFGLPCIIASQMFRWWSRFGDSPLFDSQQFRVLPVALEEVDGQTWR